MDANQILSDVQVVFRDVLDNDDIVLTEGTTALDIDEWDSLSHIQLVSALEKHFKIKFTTTEISSWKGIGELTKTIATKIG